MEVRKRMKIEIDTHRDVLIVDNMHFDLQIFRNWRDWPIGTLYRIESREDNGVLTITKVQKDEQAA